MTEILHDTSTTTLTDAIDANLIEKSLSFARFFGGKLYGPNPRWFITGKKMRANNGIVSATFMKDEAESKIEQIVAPFKAQGRPLTWWVGPRTSPSDLGKYLQWHDFVHNRDMIGMAIDINDLPQPETTSTFSLEPVSNINMLKTWYTIILNCFPATYSQTYFDALAAISLRPHADWLHYVGKANGDVVSASSLFLGGGVAGLYNLGTHPQVREQGYGAQTTIKTFFEARDRGYQIGTLQTTYPNALRMYHRMGFEVYCKIGIYRYIPKDK